MEPVRGRICPEVMEMSTVKDRVTNIKNRLSHSFSRLRKGIGARWRSLTPGFRYAIVYFLCVVCIASVVWWQFNPGSSLVFDPTANLDPQGNDPQGQYPVPDTDEEGESQDVAVFSPLRGDKLTFPMQGTILASPGNPFYMFPGYASADIDGIHIEGTVGDAVCAAWQGIVKKVMPPGIFDPGKVWIKHGEWTTVYINIEGVAVNEGQTVQAGEKVGELAAKLFGPYSCDYLEFQLWDPDEEPQDPYQFARDGH